MGTPLYSTDIIPMTSRPTLTVMDDGDYFVILDTSTGKISKILKTNIMTALKITYDNTTSGLTAETVQAALDELVVNLGSSGSAILALSGRLDTLEGVVDTNRLYSDSQYLELKAQADAQALEIQASRAELYNGYKILQFGSTDIIGKGTKADYSAIDVSDNVVDGKLSMEQKGLTITNLVDGADIADSGTVSFNTVNGDKYFDTLNETIITGDGTEMSATNSSGATANMAIYHLNGLGLQSITDTAILAKLLPYVDGTKNVGKMGMRVVGKNLWDAKKRFSDLVTAWASIGASIVNDNGRTCLKITYFSAYRSIPLYQYPFIIGQQYTLKFQAKKITALAGLGVQIVHTDGTSIGKYPMTTEYTSNTVTSTAGKTVSRIEFSVGDAGYILIDLDTIQLELGSTATPYEPYQEQLTFLPAIGNSLPNGTADSVKTVADGWEHSKRVSTPSSVGSGVAVNTTNYPTAKNAGQWVNELTAGGTEIGVIGTDSTTGAGMLRFELATPIVTKYDLPHLTSGRTIHRFAGEEKISLYGTGVTFSENVLTVLSAIKFVAGVMTDITDLATITDDTVMFSGVSATDVVYVKVEHDVDRPLGILEHTPAVSNTASRLASLEARVTALEV